MEKYRYEDIDIKKLKLDSFNPRIPNSLHGKDEKEIIEFLLLDASLVELMQAIGENDFFPGEQLLVVPNSNETYEVVEGNRRLAAVKLLNNPDFTTIQNSKVKAVYNNAKYKPKAIPCLIFNEKNEISKYLGYRHITGVKSWKSLEKARYLKQLFDSIQHTGSFTEKCRDLAKIIGSKRDYVQRVIIGINIYQYIEENSFFKIKGLDDTTFYFVNLTDSLNRNNISSFFGIPDHNKFKNDFDRSAVKEWTQWLFEKNSENKTRMRGTSKLLSILNDVLNNPNALTAFREGKNIEEAHLLTKEIDEVFNKSILSGKRSLEEADYVSHRVKDYYKSLEDDLKDIVELCKKIRSTKRERENDNYEF